MPMTLGKVESSIRYPPLRRPRIDANTRRSLRSLADGESRIPEQRGGHEKFHYLWSRGFLSFRTTNRRLHSPLTTSNRCRLPCFPGAGHHWSEKNRNRAGFLTDEVQWDFSLSLSLSKRFLSLIHLLRRSQFTNNHRHRRSTLPSRSQTSSLCPCFSAKESEVFSYCLRLPLQRRYSSPACLGRPVSDLPIRRG